MAEKILVASLSIDDKQLLKSISDTKKAIDSLSDTQKDLKKSGDSNSKTFVQNEANLKSLKSEYGSQIKVLQATKTSQSKLDAAMSKNNKSIDEATKNSKELKAVRNQINTSTEEGAQAVTDINKKIDENTKFIKTNISSQEKQTANVGNYTKGIGKARMGAIAFGSALKAAGIGLAVAAVAKLTSVFSENQKVMDVVNMVSNAFSIVMKDIVNFVVNNTGNIVKFFKAIAVDPLASIKNFGTLIKENLTERFESAIKLMGLLASAAKKFLSKDFAGAWDDVKSAGREAVDVYTGVNDSLNKAGDAISGISKSINEYGKAVLTAAENQVKLEQNSLVAEAQNKRLIEQYDRQAEQLRQVRDDESKTFEERISANEKLGNVLNEQERLMIKNAELTVANAANQNDLNGTTESYVALIEAQAAKEGILAQIEGQRSEQLTNRIGLLKESGKADDEAKQKEIDREISTQEKLRTLREEFLLSEQEVEIAKLEAEQEKHLLELETLGLRETEKEELKQAILSDGAEQLSAINDKYNKDEIEGDAKVIMEKMRMREESLDGILSLTEAETGIGKAALLAKQALALEEWAITQGLLKAKGKSAIKEAGVDQKSGLSKAIASAPFPANIPLVLGQLAQSVPALLAVGTAVAGISGVSRPKFQRGGILYGASHANGGIRTPYGELEGGEAVINKRSTRMFAPLLSNLNQMGGGKKFADGGITGGVRAPSSIIDYDRLQQAFVAGASSVTNTVSVEEIRTVTNRVNVIENNSSF